MPFSLFTKSAAFLFLFLVSGCYTTPPPPTLGLQPQFQGFVPGLILAFPTLNVPDPLQDSATVDTAILLADGVQKSLETQVLKAFQVQPNIRGYSFEAVGKGLEKQKSPLQETFQARLQEIIDEREQNPQRENPCEQAKRFIDFYTSCVAPNKLWQESLHHFSREFFYGDTALFVFVTNGFTQKNPKQLQESEQTTNLFLSFSVLLVDTNSGDLIWMNSAQGHSEAQPQQTLPQSWQTLIGRLLDENFFANFPGRIDK